MCDRYCREMMCRGGVMEGWREIEEVDSVCFSGGGSCGGVCVSLVCDIYMCIIGFTIATTTSST